MRELAWEMMVTARRHGARVIVHGSDATDNAMEFLRRGAECVLEGEAEYSLLYVVQALLAGAGPANIRVFCAHRERAWASSGTGSRNASRQLDVAATARDLLDLSGVSQGVKVLTVFSR